MTVCSNCDSGSKYYVGDVGTSIIVDVCSDISSASVANLIVQKPDDTVVVWEGTVFELHYILYVVKDGDFDQIGEYSVKSYVEVAGWKGSGEITTFRVSRTFIQE